MLLIAALASVALAVTMPASASRPAATRSAERSSGGPAQAQVAQRSPETASPQDTDVAAAIAGARAIQPGADAAAMDTALGPYVARAKARVAQRAREASGANGAGGAAARTAREIALATVAGPSIAGRDKADRTPSVAAMAARSPDYAALATTSLAPAPADSAAAAAAAAGDPTDVQGWRSFDMDGAGYLGSGGALAVGPGAVLGAVNGALRAWDKTGNPLMDAKDLTTWFEPLVGQVMDDFGLEVHVVTPRAAYSAAHRRFVLTAVAQPADPEIDVPLLFVGVSSGPDPSASFCVARITPLFSDDLDGLGIASYSMSVNAHAIALAVNLYQRQDDGTAVGFASRAYIEALAPMVNCQARASELYDVYESSDFDRFNSLYAADTLGAGDATVFVGSHDAAGALLQPLVMQWAADGSATDVAAITPIAVPSYTFPPDATQPGAAGDIASGWADVRSAVYLGPDDLWTAQGVTVDASAGVAWQRLSLGGVALDGGRVGLQGGTYLYHPQIMPALDCDTAFIAFNYSGPTEPVSAAILQLGATSTTAIAQGSACVGLAGEDVMPWDQRVPIAYDPYDGLYWLQPSVADGSDADCTANQWATHIVRVAWDLCDTGGPRPTPPPSEGAKGIGFALGSKRFMRGIQAPGGLVERDGAMRGAALTGIQVQNIDGVRTAAPAIEFAEQRSPYEAPGRALFVRTIDMNTIPPGASLNSYIPSLDLIDAMFRVTISTPNDGGDISAILRTDWDTGGAAIVSDLWNASRVVIPRAVRAADTHTSVIAVTNATLAPTSVTMRFYASGSSVVVATKRFDMLPAEALTFDLLDADPAFNALGDGFVGTAILETDGNPVGAQVYEYVEASALAIGGYEGIPADQASSRLFVPLFRHQQHGPGGIRLDTAIAVANAGDQPTSVTVSYYPTTNASASAACRAAGLIWHGPFVIQPHSSYTFSQGPGGGSGLPDDCFGSAVVDAVDAGGALVATVLDAQNGDEQLSMINALPVEFAATKYALPLFRSRHLVAEYTTGIQVMNTSGRAANVHIDFSRSEGNLTFPITGCRGQCDALIPPNEAYTWWPPAVTAIPAGTYGAAVIESDQPIVVLVNDYPLRGNSDMATYAGIPVLVAP